jgi:CheY-like chemotaxis protein
LHFLPPGFHNRGAPSIYLVALTGYALPDKAKEAGFDEHIAKPASMERIEQVLASAPTTGSCN